MRFPEFTGKWKHIKVSELLQFYSTNSLSWEQLNYDDGDILNLHYGLIHKGVPTIVDAEKETLPFISEGNEPRNYTVCKNGDVAFADASEDTNDVGKAIEFVNIGTHKIVCGLHTIHGRDKIETTIPGFKGYAFASTAFHNQVRRIAQGTKIYSISTKNFEEIFIGIPQKEEQTKIARLLCLIDERIAAQNKIIDNLQSLIKGLVVVHYNSSSLGNSIKISELGEPFSVMNLSKEQLTTNGQPCIIYGELFTRYGAVINEVISRTQVSEGITYSTGRDLLFPSSTTVDAISLIAPSALNQKGVILGGDMFGIKVNEKFSVSYLSYFFNYICASELAKYAKGSTIIHLHYKEIANHKIKLPTLEAQKNFICMATNLQCKIDVEFKILRELQNLKSYLLDTMFI